MVSPRIAAGRPARSGGVSFHPVQTVISEGARTLPVYYAVFVDSTANAPDAALAWEAAVGGKCRKSHDLAAAKRCWHFSCKVAVDYKVPKQNQQGL